MSKWINIKDRVPICVAENLVPEGYVSDLVLVYDDIYGIVVAFYEDYGTRYDWFMVGVVDNVLLRNVKYWMEIPELPEEKEK